MIDDKDISDALKNYFSALNRLRELKITSNSKDFTSQIGEWLVSQIFDGQKARSGVQKYWDLIVNDKKIQVKTHAKAPTTKARWSAIKYDESAEIDELIIIVFTQNYKLLEFYKVPWNVALHKIKRNKDRDVISWDDLYQFKILKDQLPKQNLINLFS